MPVGSGLAVADEWGRRLRQAGARNPMLQVYGGRSFQDAVWAAEQLSADMAVVSAGLGLLDTATAEIPGYNCTIVDGVEDSLSSKITDGFSRRAWWRHLGRVSPFSTNLVDVVARTDPGPVLVALSDGYLDMLSDDLASLPGGQLARLRIFTRAPIARIVPSLRYYVMPYDDRLDGPDSPIKGTRSDFASRALRHFVDVIIASAPNGSVEAHAERVRGALEGMSFPQQFQRERLEDDEILKRIHQHWDAAAGSSARLLRIFRDQLNIGCEQGRFAKLVRQAKAER